MSFIERHFSVVTLPSQGSQNNVTQKEWLEGRPRKIITINSTPLARMVSFPEIRIRVERHKRQT